MTYSTPQRRSPTVMPPTSRPLILPGTQTASFWIDESGSKTTAADCFVVGMIKTRHPDDLQRTIHGIRESNSHYQDEMKFGRIKASNYRIYAQLVDALEESDAHIAATVVDGAAHNPFRSREVWVAQAEIVSRLVAGCLNRNEVGSVFMDLVNTPPGESMGRRVKRSINDQLRSPSVVTAVSLNSKTNDLLQAADLVAGAIFYTRLRVREVENEHKMRIAKRLALAFGVPDLQDARTERVNIATLRAHHKRR